MGLDKSNEAIEAYKIFKNGLDAEDTAFSARSNNLLTFNSLLAIAFVGILQKGFNLYWESILIYGIPIFAIIINIIWLWLGCRTMLSFIYYFNEVRKIENDLDSKYFDYSRSRMRFWEENKDGITFLVSIRAGANKLFCYRLPQITYVIWATLLVLVISKYAGCFIAIPVIAFGFSILLAIFIWIEIKSLRRYKISSDEISKN